MNLYALLFVDDYPAEKGDPGFEGWVGAGHWQTKNIRAFPRRATSVMSYIVFIFFFYCYAFHQFLYWHKYLNSSQNFKLPWVNNKVELGASLEWQISMKSSMRLLAVFLQPQHWGSEVNSKDGNACQMPGKKKCCIIGQNEKQSLKTGYAIWVEFKKYSCAEKYPAAVLVWHKPKEISHFLFYS